MPAKPSGEIKTKIIHQVQKNGDTYVLERKTLYEPATRTRRSLWGIIVMTESRLRRYKIPWKWH